PSAHVRAEASGVMSRLTRARDGSEFARTIIPRAKLEYQPTRALFVRVVSQYTALRADQLRDAITGSPIYSNGQLARQSSESGRVRTDWLLSYQPTPGTVAFFGYGDTYSSPDRSTLSRLSRTGDGFFVK